MCATAILATTFALAADAADSDDQSLKALPVEYRDEFLKAKLSPDAPKAISVIGTGPKTLTIPMREGLTVTKAIESAGGFNDFANHGKVGVWRSAEGRFFLVDVSVVQEKKPGADDPLLKPGDVVIVIAKTLY